MIKSEYTLLKICVEHCLDEEWVLSSEQKETLQKWLGMLEAEGKRLHLLTEEQEEDQDPDEAILTTTSIPVVGHTLCSHTLGKENSVPSVLQSS